MQTKSILACCGAVSLTALLLGAARSDRADSVTPDRAFVFPSQIEQLENTPSSMCRLDRFPLGSLEERMMAPTRRSLPARKIVASAVRLTTPLSESAGAKYGVELVFPEGCGGRMVIDANRLEDVLKVLRTFDAEARRAVAAPFKEVSMSYKDPSGMWIRSVSFVESRVLVELTEENVTAVQAGLAVPGTTGETVKVFLDELIRAFTNAKDQLDVLKK